MQEPLYCVHCGGELTLADRDGRPRSVCTRCGYIHYVNPIVAAGVLAEAEGRVLLIRRAVPPRAGAWGLPAGYAEVGEHPEQTAQRETLEETGVAVQLCGLLDIMTFGGGGEPFGVLLLYAARALTLSARAGDDALEARFFAPDELPAEIAFSAHRRALERWCAGQSPFAADNEART